MQVIDSKNNSHQCDMPSSVLVLQTDMAAERSDREGEVSLRFVSQRSFALRDLIQFDASWAQISWKRSVKPESKHS